MTSNHLYRGLYIEHRHDREQSLIVYGWCGSINLGGVKEMLILHDETGGT